MKEKILENIGTIEKLSIENLIEYDKNNKQHGEKQISAIASSFERFGYYNEIIVDKNNIIITGHGRLATAKKMGYTHIKVKKILLDSTEAGAMRIIDNMLSNFDTVDDLENIVFDLDSGIDISLGEFTKDDFFPELNAPDYNPEDYENDLANQTDDGILKVSFILPNPEQVEEIQTYLQENYGIEKLIY